MLDRCPICGEIRLFNHKCKPRWAVFLDIDGDPASIFADDEQAAVVEYASEHDNGDYHLLNGGELDVRVCTWGEWQEITDLENEDATNAVIAKLPRYRATGYLVPEYTATRIKEVTHAEL